MGLDCRLVICSSGLLSIVLHSSFLSLTDHNPIPHLKWRQIPFSHALRNICWRSTDIAKGILWRDYRQWPKTCFVSFSRNQVGAECKGRTTHLKKCQRAMSHPHMIQFSDWGNRWNISKGKYKQRVQGWQRGKLWAVGGGFIHGSWPKEVCRDRCGIDPLEAGSLWPGSQDRKSVV